MMYWHVNTSILMKYCNDISKYIRHQYKFGRIKVRSVNFENNFKHNIEIVITRKCSWRSQKILLQIYD